MHVINEPLEVFVRIDVFSFEPGGEEGACAVVFFVEVHRIGSADFLHKDARPTFKAFSQDEVDVVVH